MFYVALARRQQQGERAFTPGAGVTWVDNGPSPVQTHALAATTAAASVCQDSSATALPPSAPPPPLNITQHGGGAF